MSCAALHYPWLGFRIRIVCHHCHPWTTMDSTGHHWTTFAPWLLCFHSACMSFRLWYAPWWLKALAWVITIALHVLVDQQQYCIKLQYHHRSISTQPAQRTKVHTIRHCSIHWVHYWTAIQLFSGARLGLQDRLYIVARSAGELYQALAGSKKATLSAYHAACNVVFLFCHCLWRVIAVSRLLVFVLTSPCERYTSLAREIAENKKQQSAGHVSIIYTIYYSFLSVHWHFNV